MDGYRHISCVEKVNNLRTFIKDDLLNCGVKLPKNKKAKKLNNSRGPSQDGIHVPTGIFGNYLAHVPCEYVADCGYVPKFLVDSAEHIRMHFKTEGIFRKSGSVSRQKELKQQIEEGVSMDVSSIYDLTTLIKQFFRELPEPLFTSLYHDTFIKCYQLDDTKTASEAIHALCLLLPAEHLSTLRFIMQLLSFIASHSDDNKMDAANLAVVLAPNIMHVNSKSEKMNSTEEKLLQIQTAIVELLIKEAEKVGMVSSSLYQRTTLMTECFGVATDDELDASDDNTLEDSKDMKKKKKRKRSGSLQGIVSSIANGLAKLRRSTDGKNGNSSQNMTTASNESAQSLSGSMEQPNYPTTTPVVIRKRKASGEVIPFSASKKKAILQHLPQGSALGHTPFTPASAIRKMDINDPRKGGVMDTPSLSFGDKQQMPYTATPSHNMKTPRKKLNLFSPSSSKKKMARSPSFSNISTGSTKKSGRGKNIFRRLSGSKADKSSASDSSLHVGERLASPTKKNDAMDSGSMRRSQSESDSPISALAQNTTYMPDTSVVSHMDIKQTLNEGFINESHLDLDQTDVGSGLQRSHSLYRPVHASASDPVVAGTNTGGPHKRSLSAEGMNLRRGQPNTINNGLLKGQHNHLKKLRKSFDKSDISGPIPIIVPTVCDGKESDQRLEGEKIQKVPPLPPLSAPKQNSSLMNVVLPPPHGFNDTLQQTGYDSDESEAGFSTISGDTVIYIPKQSSSSTSLQSNKSQGSQRGQGRMSAQTSRENVKKGLQTSNSSDSLLSSASEMSVESNTSKLERCLSTDSGKGSLFDETLTQPPAQEPKDSLDVAFVADESMLLDTTVLKKSDCMDSSIVKPSDSSLPHQPIVKKSHSAQQLALPPRPGVVRSQSMYSHQEARKHNIKPNLLISAETHKILSRAGYFPDKAPQQSGKDFRLPVKSPPRSHSFNVCRRNATLGDQSMFDESQLCSKSIHDIQDVSQRSSCDTPRRHNVSDTEPRMQSCDLPGIANNSRLQPGTQKMELLQEKQQMLPQIKRAEMSLPKHESVSQMQVSNAGKVAENVKQFTDVVEQQLLSVPRSAPKQRGMSPVRIPTIFAKNNDMSARYRDIAQAAIERGRLASEDRLSNISDVTSHSSITNDSISSISTLTDSETEDTFKHPASVSMDAAVKTNVSTSVTSLDESVNMVTDIRSKISFEGQQVDLSCSLLDTINDICTPKIERKSGTNSRSPLKDCGNNMAGLSPTKPMEITDHVLLRTASGMTPRQILRFSQPSRSSSKTVPNKSTKRLSSPGHTLKNSRSPNKQSSTSLPDNTAQAM